MAALLDDLDAEQRAAAVAVTGPVCIVAGAGIGKTRTVTHRLAHAISTGAVKPGTVLAVTHSRKAAGELGGRLDQLGVRGVEAYTFHAAALKVARQHWVQTGRPGATPVVLGEREAWGVWREAARSVTRVEADTATVRDLMDEVGWARSQLVAIDGYADAAVKANRHPGIDLATVSQCWQAYERVKRRVGKVDFADMLEIATGLLETDADVAETMRRRWAHVTVDEYQDTDSAQQRLLDAIVGDGRDICVVGDPRQAIYSWKGADWRYLNEFGRRHPGVQRFELTRSYRSSPEILEWANRLARTSTAMPLAPTRPAGPRPTVSAFDDEAAETAKVVTEIRRAITGGAPPSEIAILYRFNASQVRFEAALTAEGIASVVAEDTTFFEREDVRAVLVPFGQAARAEPERPGLALLNEILIRAGFNRDLPPESLGAVRARWESHEALLELVESSPNRMKTDAQALLAEINGLAVRTAGPQGERVTLATLHRAKGLEWDVVFIVDVTDGAIPSFYAETPAERAEEGRLLHVGVSRARRELHLSWAATNARGWTKRPSPYLDLLPSRPPRSPPASRERRPRAATAAARIGSKDRGGMTCPHCADPLKGISARRIGVCVNCVVRAPGQLGDRARKLDEVVRRGARGTPGSNRQPGGVRPSAGPATDQWGRRERHCWSSTDG
jgi:DNA helicase II / ATP-dependent DNA helicase PcrA